MANPYDQQATRDVNSIYGPQYQSLDAQIAAQQAQAQQQAAAYQQWAQAQAAALQQVAPQIQQTYQSAAQSDAVFGRGFADGLKQAQQGNAGDINKILSQNGAPAGQMQNVTNDASDVLYGTTGYLPAQTLNQQGAAFAAAAAMLPATALGQSRYAIFDLFKQAQDASNQLRLKRFDIDSAKAQALLGLKGQYADAATKREALDFERQLAAKKFGLDVYKAKQSAADKAADRRMRALQNNRQWQLGLDRLGIQEQGLRLRATELEWRRRNSGKKGGFTAKDLLKIRGTAESVASNAYTGFTDPNGTEHEALDYTAAMSEMIKAGVPPAIASQFLNRYYKPGERGRPMNARQRKLQGTIYRAIIGGS